MTTNKSTLAALNLVQSDTAQGTPHSLLARILDLETVASGALAQLRQKEADEIKAAASAVASAVAAPVETLETLSAKLAALMAKKPAEQTA